MFTYVFIAMYEKMSYHKIFTENFIFMHHSTHDVPCAHVVCPAHVGYQKF